MPLHEWYTGSGDTRKGCNTRAPPEATKEDRTQLFALVQAEARELVLFATTTFPGDGRSNLQRSPSKGTMVVEWDDNDWNLERNYS